MASTELHDQLWDNAKYLKDGLKNSDSILVNQKHQLHQLLLVMKKKLKNLVNVLKMKAYM